MATEKKSDQPTPNTTNLTDVVTGGIRNTTVTHTFSPGEGLNSASVGLTSQGERLTGYQVNGQGTVSTGTGPGTVNIGVSGTPQGNVTFTGSLSQPNPNGSTTPTVTTVGITEERNRVTQLTGTVTGSLGGQSTGNIGVTNNPQTGQTGLNAGYNNGQGGTATASIATGNQYDVNVGYAKPIPAQEAGKPLTPAVGGSVTVGANNTAGLNTSAGLQTRIPVGNNTVLGAAVDATYAPTPNTGVVNAGVTVTHTAGATRYELGVNTTNGAFSNAVASVAQGGFTASVTAKPGDRYDLQAAYTMLGESKPVKPYDSVAAANQISSTTEGFRTTQKNAMDIHSALSPEDRKLYNDAAKGVRELNEKGAKLPEQETALAIAAKAKQEGISEIKYIDLGKTNASGGQNIIIADGDPKNPATHKTSIDKNQAANTSIADSLQLIRDTPSAVQQQTPATTQERALKQ
jgi:hypothetical protein